MPIGGIAHRLHHGIPVSLIGIGQRAVPATRLHRTPRNASVISEIGKL
jgi:hypothetical protein